jgi:hypothetical protein
MEVSAYRAPIVYDKISKIAVAENKMRNTRPFCVANTYKNESEFQQAENRSRNYARSGQQKFADPFEFHPKPYNWYFEGRNLAIHKTLQYHQVKDHPELISINNLKVVGRY